MFIIPDGPEDRSPYPNALAFGGGGDGDDDEDVPSDSTSDIASSRRRRLSREDGTCMMHDCSAARPSEILSTLAMVRHATDCFRCRTMILPLMHLMGGS
jgi:hypothetical protein